MNREKRHKGFGVPEGYFDSFEDRLELKLMEEALPKSNGFAVPEGYFNSLDETMVSAIQQEEPKVISIIRRKSVYYVAAIAASLLLIITLTTNNNLPENLSDVPLTDLESYFEEYDSEYDTYDILALMSEDELSELTLDSESISEESLEDYLFENIEETSSLLIE